MELDSREQALLKEEDALANALRLILPMAKGYAHQHPVGNNLAFVLGAECVLANYDLLQAEGGSS